VLLRHLPWLCRTSDNNTVDGGADILSSGRDPGQPSRWRVPWRLVAAAAVALIGAGITLPAHLGAVRAGGPDIASVRWAGSGLWIVATDGQDSQVAYWAGAGPLRVLAPLPGTAYTFAVAAGAALRTPAITASH
jgi:hypothetical protein